MRREKPPGRQKGARLFSMLLAVCLMIAALPLSVSAAGEYVPGNPRWSGYQNQVQWDRPAGAASGDSFEYEAQLLLGDDVVESKAVEIDTYLFFTNDVVTRPQEEYTIRVRARWIMIVGDPDGQYMVADVGEWGPWATKAGSGGGEAEPPHEHSPAATKRMRRITASAHGRRMAIQRAAPAPSAATPRQGTPRRRQPPGKPRITGRIPAAKASRN